MIQNIRNSAFRHIIWPIRSKELYKFLPIALLMFTINLNLNFLRTMKDSVITTSMGAEVISFIKIWFEIPSGVIFVIIYTSMCNVMSTERAFQYVISSFLVFFAIFAFVILPNKEFYHPDPNLVTHYISTLPNLKWFIVIWGKWSFVLFYVMAELWPVVVLGLLWQLANKITKTEEAKRFYSFFTFFGQMNLLVSGVAIGYFASGNHFLVKYFTDVNDVTELTVKSIMTIVLISGIISLLVHVFVERTIIAKDKHLKITLQKSLKLGTIESAKMIFRSKYLGLICILMISYSITAILLEGIWFAKVCKMCSTPESFMAYQGKFMYWTGIIALVFALLGSSIIRRLGWLFGAILTPLITLLAGGSFLLFILFEDLLENLFAFSGLSTISLIVFLGGLQNVFMKGAKYTLFDATKEMAYIPLNPEIKTKGQAAVDIVGPKIGKAFGAIVPFVTFTIFPNTQYDDMAGFLFVILATICGIWILSVIALSRAYSSILAGNTDSNNSS